MRETEAMVGEKGLGLVNKTSGANTHRSSCRWVKRPFINASELKIDNDNVCTHWCDDVMLNPSPNIG